MWLVLWKAYILPASVVQLMLRAGVIKGTYREERQGRHPLNQFIISTVLWVVLLGLLAQTIRDRPPAPRPAPATFRSDFPQSNYLDDQKRLQEEETRRFYENIGRIPPSKGTEAQPPTR